ncbi:MAG: RNA polymerase sigma-70 factor [uncultured Thermomicrobiales bacterium]|uniref:RNA polymerase sigma-70 factor n=1 Tax=uncultured Thermomicrobiales bacterium TaxID=1645740 RepID=A0A6J4VVV0_9BACT|nr:MAG: RNA polymerase sigma-70 factor [uncultured Thermomicrobiales bacterium]
MDHAGDDEALLARLASGDRAALSPLYDRYAGPVFALLLRIVADRAAAEDLLQEVFVRVWQRAGTYQIGRGRPLTWTLGIAHNLAIDEVRRRRRRPQGVDEREAGQAEDLLAGLPSAEASPEEQAWARQRRQQIGAALRQLPPAQRAIIELAYFEGYTQSQMAERLGEPLGTIKTRLRLGIQKLREILRGQELERDLG